MSKKYEFELTEGNLEKYIDNLEKVEKALKSYEFRTFILNKCKGLLDTIMEYTDIASDQRADDYVAGNKTEIGKDYVYLYNDSTINIESADTWLNDYGKNFYPDELSLAALVEYGAGLVGSQNAKGIDGEWSYMLNPKRDYEEGWNWNNKGTIEHTQGQAGRYIYYELSEQVRKHLDEWVDEYLENAIGGNV